MATEFLHWFIFFTAISGLLYLILIAIYTYGWYFIQEPENHEQRHQQTMVSVLVAARNEADHITALLDALRKQRYPLSLVEVIIADDHSSDNTIALINAFAAENPSPSLRVISARAKGKKAALGAALLLAKGDILLFTDADCLPAPGWIAEMTARLSTGEQKMILGPVMLDPARSLFEKLQSLEFMSLIGSTAGACATGSPLMGNGASLAVTRKALEEVSTSAMNSAYASGDDVFLMFAFVKKFGRKAIGFARSAEAIVRSRPKPDLGGFIQQRLRWVSKSKGYTHPLIIFPALIVLLFNLALFGTMIMAFFLPPLWLVYALLIGFKFFVDYPLLLATAGLMQRKSLLLLVLPLACVYPVYVSLIAVAGFVLPFTWKNRSYSS